jgi:hypothetical protein
VVATSTTAVPAKILPKVDFAILMPEPPVGVGQARDPARNQMRWAEATPGIRTTDT